MTPIPITPYGAKIVLETPGAGWSPETVAEAREVLREAGPLTWRHLDPAEAQPPKPDPASLGRMAEHFEAISDREDNAALARWTVGFAVAGATLICVLVWWLG